MGCGIATVKYLLFFFNLVFALCGLAILIAGALTYANIDKANFVTEKVHNEVNFTASPIALMVVGSIIFVIAFFGCCGAIRESYCMIITFSVFLLAILIVEIAIGIVVFVKMDEEGWEQALNESITEKFAQFPYSGDASNIVVQEINNFQHDVLHVRSIKKRRRLEYCGVDGPTYWRDIHLGGVAEIPRGCCINPDVLCTSFEAAAHQVFQDGCVDRLIKLLRDIGLVLGIFAIAVGVVQIICVVFALCLASSIRKKEQGVA